MGQDQDTIRQAGSASSGHRLRPRECLRKGCGRIYQPRQWNQRYCRDRDCMRKVRRWYAAKRQRKHRSDPVNSKRHAAAEAERRRRRRESQVEASRVAAGRSHDDSAGPSWSRNTTESSSFCDRPGCYELRRFSPRAPAHYCGDECRGCMRRVRDRERKWLGRNSCANHRKRGSLAEATPARQAFMPHALDTTSAGNATFSVRNYGADENRGLSCCPFDRKEARDGHRKARPGSRSRAPPTS